MNTRFSRLLVDLGMNLLFAGFLIPQIPTLAIGQVEQTQPPAVSILVDVGLDPKNAKIDLSIPLRIQIKNESNESLRIWSPQSRTGVSQYSLEFEDVESGETFIVQREPYWIEPGRQPDMESGKVKLAPQELKSFDIIPRYWKGFPDPNSDDVFKITAVIDSSRKSETEGPPIWLGKSHSKPKTVKLVASQCSTPHDYLQAGFPDTALRIMQADRSWIERTDEYSRTPLHVAAQNGPTQVVQWLIDNGANVNAVAYNNFTPLHLATEISIVEVLLQDEVNLNSSGPFGAPIRSVCDKLYRARSDVERKKWRKVIDLYLKAGAEYDILVAIHLNDLKRVTEITQKQSKFAHEFNRATPLRLAARLGHFEICKYLIEEFDVDVDDFRGSFGQKLGYPIITEAVKYPRIVELLIKHGADLRSPLNFYGGRSGPPPVIGSDASVLHFAAASGVPESINLIVDQGIGNLVAAEDETTQKREMLAIDVAAIEGRVENVKALMKYPPFSDEKSLLRSQLLTGCLRKSISWGYLFFGESNPIELVKLLLESGANPNVDVDGATLVQIVANNIHPDSNGQNRIRREIVELMVRHGAQLDLFTAVAIGDLDAVKNLIDQHPDSVDATGPDGYPAMHFAVGMDNLDIVKALLNAGANIEILNTSEETGSVNETPLHCAAWWGREEIVRFLIDAGANLDAKDEHGSTPLQDAQSMGNSRIVEIFIEEESTQKATILRKNMLLLVVGLVFIAICGLAKKTLTPVPEMSVSI